MEKKERNRALILALIGVIGIILVFTVKGPKKVERFECGGVVWATTFNIVYYSDADLSDSIQSLFRDIELSVSPFNKKSIISAINTNESDSVDEYIDTLFSNSLRINKETGGAFDPTLSPLINAWGFGYKSGNLPDYAEVDSILQFVGIDKVKLDNGKLVKPDVRMTFDFSAIAKGYGCDVIADMLRRNGVEYYLVEIGGEIVASTSDADGSKWVVSIDKPEVVEGGILQSRMLDISVSDCGIATSGNYRNFKTDSTGRRFGHIINPKTGYPEQTEILSATVIAPNCMLADAYATAFMVMGLEKSMAFLASRSDLSAAFIVDGFKVVKTPNFPKE